MLRIAAADLIAHAVESGLVRQVVVVVHRAAKLTLTQANPRPSETFQLNELLHSVVVKVALAALTSGDL